jgi:hypothetical protein
MLGLTVGVIVVVVWLILTALCNIGSIGRALRVRDIWGLLPEWRFFAPNPIEADLRLLYRDFASADARGVWTEPPVLHGRRWWHFLWNPEKRINKSLFDAMNEVQTLALASDARVFSPSYLLLLNVVSNIRRTWPARQVQFAVAMVYGKACAGDPAVVFVSQRHDLEVEG